MNHKSYPSEITSCCRNIINEVANSVTELKLAVVSAMLGVSFAGNAAEPADICQTARLGLKSFQSGDLGKEWITNASAESLEVGSVSFVNGFIGEPKASNAYSSKELRNQGMVGIYKEKGDSCFETRVTTREMRVY